jgi:class 3 adenylate cyclase/predicted ATPase
LQTIRRWLETLGLSQYAQVFERNAVSFQITKDLTDQDLRDLGVELLGHRKMLLRAIAELNETKTPAATTPSAQALATSEQSLRSEAERRHLTVLFCDLVDSTALSARLDPEELREIVRAYQAASTRVIARYDGHMAQYLGDGLLVYFGYPAAHEDDAGRAVWAGLGIVDSLHELNKRLRDSNDVRLAVRVGIHTGLVVVGDVGAGTRHERLALGETPNLAARLQGLAQPGTVVISAATHRLLHGLFRTSDLGTHALKGLPAPVQAYRVLATSEAGSRLEAGTGLTHLVAREQEGGLLLDRWEQMTEGNGQVVLLSGEAGIGKSRLVQMLKERVAAASHTLLECRCSPYYEHSPLYPVLDLLQRLFDWTREDSPDAKLDKLVRRLGQYSIALGETVPLFASLLSLPIPERFPLPPMSAERQKRRTQEALISVLLAMAAERPVLLVIEDLHWVDPSTLDLLTLLLEQTPAARLFILLTARPSFNPAWTPRSHLSVLTMNRFTRKQTETMVNRVTGGKELPGEVLQQIVMKTDGVPLFIEELTKMVLESGLIAERDGRYELARSVPDLAIPATLQDSLMARLDRLATARDVAQLGATLGRAFPYLLLRAVSPLDEPSLQRELGRLVEAELLYQRGLPPQATFIFKHALIQDAAYQSLLKTTRQQYHQRVARVMVDQFPEDVESRPEFVAHHFARAGLHRQAVEYWQRAGGRALQRSAMPEAIAHLNEGLAALQGVPEGEDRLRQELALQTSLGAALIATRGFASADVERAFRRAQELGRQVGDSALLFPALMGLWIFHQVRFEHEVAREIAEQCVALAERERDPALLVEAHRAAGTTLSWLGRGQIAQTHFEKTLAYYDRDRHRQHTILYGQDSAVGALCWFAVTLWGLGFPDQALLRIEQAQRLADELKHPFSQAWGTLFRAFVHHLRKEWTAAQESAEACIALSTEQTFPAWVGLASVYRAHAIAQLGRPRDAIEMLQQILVAFEAVGEVQGIPFFLTFLANTYVDVGRADEALRVINDALSRAGRNSGHWCESLLHRTKADVLLKLAVPDQDQAEGCFQKAIDVARDQQARSFELQASVGLARFWDTVGNRRQAHALLLPIYNWFTEGFATKDLLEAKTLLEALA